MIRHGDLCIDIFSDPLFGENGMLLRVAGDRQAWLIDPGLPPQPDQMRAALKHERLQPAAILLTHCHADHIAGVEPLREHFPDLPVVCPRGEELLLTDANANLSAAFGMPVAARPPQRLIAAGDILTLGRLEWRAIDVAGHSPAALGYYCAAAGVLIVGDAVFADSIGRTDFPHSDHERLLRNIRDHVLTLPPETVVYPGHGPTATVAQIQRHNRLLRDLLEQLA